MKISNATKVGIITILSIVVFVGGLVWKSGVFLKASGYRIHGSFQTVNGLLLSSQVRYRGFLVGRVEKIIPGTKGVKVTLLIKKGTILPAKSRMRVSFDGLIGEKYMDILPVEATSEVMRPEALLPGFASKGLVDFVDLGAKNLEETVKIIESFKDILTAPEVKDSLTGTLVRMDDISKKIDQLLANVNQFTSSSEITELVKSFNSTAKLLNKTAETIFAQEQQDNFSDTLVNIKNLSGDLSKISSAFSDLIYEEGTTKNMKVLLENTNEALTQLTKMMGKADVKETISETNKALTQTNELLTSLRSIKVEPNAGINADMKTDDVYYGVGAKIHMFEKYLAVAGIDNRDGSNELNDLQLGLKIVPDVVARVGKIRSFSGLGVDYSIVEKMTLSTDLIYRNSKLDSDLSLKYIVIDKLFFKVGFQSLLDKDESKVVLGLGF